MGKLLTFTSIQLVLLDEHEWFSWNPFKIVAKRNMHVNYKIKAFMYNTNDRVNVL